MTSTPNAFDWNHIRAFLATAETGSLSAAARRLNLTQPTLSRQVAALEESLGLMLFERIGKSLQLTQAGVELLEHTRPMGLAADRIALAALGQSESITGTVRITASDVYSAYLLPDVLRRLRQLAPDLHIDIIASNDIRDLMRREADIAIRHVRPEQPELIARLINEETARFYAAPQYLAKAGRPEDLRDLSNHDFISFGDAEGMVGHLTPLGFPLTKRNFRYETQSGLVAWELVKRGFGIAPMSDRIARQTPEVERLLPQMEPIRFPVWLTTHRELHTSRKIRLVFDLLAEHFFQK
ncbi:LysR family transcriptional regulator [Phaeobacter gallaeciensis]|jgi:DNA-binding transcriptional LysR family regulator|uniref:LysR family transcriptional regulator n=1 Tax=Phaeobacter gallaeciensis TaxID=60890 RepID=UPI00237FD28D|nr:LysR family transcriptional regulator [Phaeobacter gallaeciensis]MDE4303846.1 LysR family transcriptional regulator [Phaeobacter gallaeciensis]MDE4308905.1 LysR family transcriptional regulator [Phaeobacter gallaeciensis]MDE4313541.1 LysR family transcriptional regulator [Phaeobacter gallaeciensis]MDE4317834.1 LysR family transcriptional regulator [Phaeobacter gallaeciensis]MDE4322297.1 LysR family transcriptional regulator [Phaeobacter gallaeciensis]